MSHLPSMDNLENSGEHVPAVSPCGSIDQLLHLSTEEQEMDVESINTSGDINEDLLFLDEVDVEEESTDYYTEHGSTKSKEGAKNFLKYEKCAGASGVSTKEELFSVPLGLSAQANTISKGIRMAVRAKQETDAENRKACSSESLKCSNGYGMIMVNFDGDVERQRDIVVEPVPENGESAQLLHISAVHGACNSVLGADIKEECTEKPVNSFVVERGADKADSKAAVSIPHDSNLIVLTRHQLELYAALRTRQCLVAEHTAQLQSLEKKYCALQRAIIWWRCRVLQQRQQLRNTIRTENRQPGLRRRPRQRSFGMLVRPPSPERQQPSSPLSPPPTVAPAATAEAPPVAMVTQLSAAPPLVTMATPTSKLSHPSPHFFEPATPAVITHSTSPTNQRLPAPHPRATTGSTAQPTVLVPADLLAQLPPTKQQLPQFSSLEVTPPVRTATVPVSMETESVFMPSVPTGMGTPLILVEMPSVATGQTASPQFFNPAMAVADSRSDSPTSLPFKTLCFSQPIVAAANANMLTAGGTVGMLVQLSSANQQEHSFAPAMARPPIVMEAVPVSMESPPVSTAGPVVFMAVPPVPVAGPSVAMAGPPITMTGPPVPMAMPPNAIKAPVSNSGSPPHFFCPSMAVGSSFGTSQASTATPTRQPVVTAANATMLTTTEEANEAPSGSLVVQPVLAPSCAASCTASTNEIIDLTLEEEAESTVVKVTPGTGTRSSFAASEMRQISVPVGEVLKIAPELSTQNSTLPVANCRWQPPAKAGLPISVRVQYYMPCCMVTTPQVPDTWPATNDALQQPAPPILVPVSPSKGSQSVCAAGIGAAAPGGSLAIGDLSPFCPTRSPCEPLAVDSTVTAAKATWSETQVPEDTSFPLLNVSSHLITDVTWSGATQYSSVGGVVQNSPPPAATSLLSSVASPCVPSLVEVDEVDVSIFKAGEASSCDADRPKRTAADRMRDCRLRKKLAAVSPMKKVPKSGAQRIREFRERLKAKTLAGNSTMDEQLQGHKLPSDRDDADTGFIGQAEEQDLDLILICDSDSCPSSPLGENNVEHLATGITSPQGHGATMH